MELECGKLCWDKGECSPYPRSVEEQWKWTLDQVVSGIKEEDRERELDAIKKLWKEAQKQKILPPPEVKVNLAEALCKWESEIHTRLQDHLDNPKLGFIAGKSWKKQGKELEDKRRRIHVVAVACAAVHYFRSGRVTRVPNVEKPLLKDLNQTLTLNTTLYPSLPTTSSPPPYQLPILTINSGQLDVDRDEELEELRETVCELWRQVRRIKQRQKEVGDKLGKNEFREEVQVGCPKISQQTIFKKQDSQKSTLNIFKTLSNHIKQAKRVDPSGGFARAERREEKARLIYGSDKEDSENKTDTFKLPATFIGELEHQEHVHPQTELYEKDQGSSMGNCELELWEESECEYRGEPLTGAINNEEVGQIHTQSKGPVSGMPQLQAPLIQKRGGQEPVYIPFAITDINCLVDKMPPPAEGGGKWMSRLFSLTQSMQLVMGDFRGILGRQVSLWDLDKVEVAAGIKDRPNAARFGPCATRVGEAMRQVFPISPGAMQNLRFKWEESESAHGFLTRCKEEWMCATGCHPGSDNLHTTLFHQAIILGLPQLVKEAMEGNPDLPGSTADVWERHLSHHINTFKAKQQGKKEEVMTAQEQLLKIQLDEALKKLNDKQKEEKQMVQQFPRQVQPDQLCPQQDFALINPYWASPRGGMCGRHGRQGYGLIGGYLGRDQCHACKGYGHWQRDCPYHNYPEVPGSVTFSDGLCSDGTYNT
ncbi:uncharacterized protein LOC130524190 [Takifugu flavidus]|uniref:uncharacterized protein LOC130524190 n=1 Tax=Takifugu flavidus TaxID=433684 RepID=UPI00254486F1|nr:uncharacterized protein LOC130524190 [Takifugu flavidus]